ncbi:MAG: signal recognition particle-docking protein FtsY [Candidatus Aenigmatarchaeota archaeon]
MFGALKKALKGAISKVTGKIEKEPPSEAAAQAREREARRAERGRAEKAEEKAPAAERLEAEIEEHVEELKAVEEKVHEEHIPGDHALLKEEERALEEVKKEVGEIKEIKPTEEKPKARKAPARGILKRIVEKTLSESDIEEVLKELEMALLENDVAVEVAERIGADVKAVLMGKAVRRGKTEEIIRTALRDAILDVLDQPRIDLEKRIREKDGPFLITLIGFNGTGKTTTLAKLAHRFKQFNPVLAAGDTFRAASIEQLEEHSRRLGAEVVKHKYGADSAAVIFDAMKHAQAIGSKLVLADTAGRSHANVNLMDELKKVIRVNKPDLKILVLDALAGNDIYDQARLFDQAVGVDAIILSKADVYDKGGAALSAAYTIKKPILFLGTGQGYKDLQAFSPHKIAESLLE